MLSNYYKNCFAIYAILVFQSKNSGYRLFQILWILYLRPLLFDAQYFTSDTNCGSSVSYTRYTSLSTSDLALPSQVFMDLIISKPSLQDVYPSSSVAIGLPAFGFCHLHYSDYPMRKLTSYYKGKRSIASNQFLNLTTNSGAQIW